MRLLFGTVVALMAVAGVARADRFSSIDGTRLVALCTSRDEVRVQECTAYINGVSDAASLYQNLLPADGGNGGRLPAYLCMPGAITGVQLRETVVSRARMHPESQGIQASSVVLRALRDAFRCQGIDS